MCWADLWHGDEHGAFFVLFSYISESTENEHTHDDDQHQKTKLLVTLKQSLERIIFSFIEQQKKTFIIPYVDWLIRIFNFNRISSQKFTKETVHEIRC